MIRAEADDSGSALLAVTPEQLKDADLEAPPVPVSIYVLADLDSPDGRKLATSALKFVVRTRTAVCRHAPRC